MAHGVRQDPSIHPSIDHNSLFTRQWFMAVRKGSTLRGIYTLFSHSKCTTSFIDFQRRQPPQPPPSSCPRHARKGLKRWLTPLASKWGTLHDGEGVPHGRGGLSYRWENLAEVDLFSSRGIKLAVTFLRFRDRKNVCKSLSFSSMILYDMILLMVVAPQGWWTWKTSGVRTRGAWREGCSGTSARGRGFAAGTGWKVGIFQHQSMLYICRVGDFA